MIRNILMVFAAAGSIPALASAQGPQDAGHAAASAPPVASASELDALNKGTEEDFSDFEEVQVRKPVSVTVRALDKITARYKDLTVKIDESAKFGSLEILPRYCDQRPPEDFPETTAFLEVFDRDLSRARAAASVVVRVDEKKPAKARAAPVAPTLAPATGSDLPSALDPDRIFSGWMFASSPALNPLEHPVYDVWVIDCKTAAAGN